MPSEQLVSQSGNKDMYSALLKAASGSSEKGKKDNEDLNQLASQFQEIVENIEQ